MNQPRSLLFVPYLHPHLSGESTEVQAGGVFALCRPARELQSWGWSQGCAVAKSVPLCSGGCLPGLSLMSCPLCSSATLGEWLTSLRLIYQKGMELMSDMG